MPRALSRAWSPWLVNKASRENHRIAGGSEPGNFGEEECGAGNNFMARGLTDTSVIREPFVAVEQDLTERSRRPLAAAGAGTPAYGWIAAASKATRIARGTIGRRLKDPAEPIMTSPTRAGGLIELDDDRLDVEYGDHVPFIDDRPSI
jgi:hypothetical protein